MACGPTNPARADGAFHWRATARTGELHVIEWEEETASDLTILIDTHADFVAGAPGAAGDDTLEASIVAAASVAAFLLESGQRARLFWWADAPSAAATSARLMSVEARHQAGLTQVLTALAQIEACHGSGATLATLSARVRRETGDEAALLLGSDRAAWSEALQPWQRERFGAGAHGLAFEAASFEERARAGLTLRAGGAVVATLQRAGASNAGAKPSLPARVRRLSRSDSLVDALEQKF